MDKYDKYRKSIEEALRENFELAGQKRELEAQIRRIQQFVLANIDMLPDKEEAQKYREALEDVQGPTGLKSAILSVLRTDTYLRPPVIRALISKHGYDLSSHVNSMASVHTTLKRLVNDGLAETEAKGGTTLYRRKIKRVVVKEKV